MRDQARLQDCKLEYLRLLDMAFPGDERPPLRMPALEAGQVGNGALGAHKVKRLAHAPALAEYGTCDPECRRGAASTATARHQKKNQKPPPEPPEPAPP